MIHCLTVYKNLHVCLYIFLKLWQQALHTCVCCKEAVKLCTGGWAEDCVLKPVLFDGSVFWKITKIVWTVNRMACFAPQNIAFFKALNKILFHRTDKCTGKVKGLAVSFTSLEQNFAIGYFVIIVFIVLWTNIYTATSYTEICVVMFLQADGKLIKSWSCFIYTSLTFRLV